MKQQAIDLPDHANRCAGRISRENACPLRPTCLRFTTLIDDQNLPDYVLMNIPVATHYCTTPINEHYIAADTDADESP